MNGPRQPPMSSSQSSPPLQYPLSLGLVPVSPPPHRPSSPPPPPPPPHARAADSPVARVRLSDIAPYEGAAGDTYQRAVNALSASLTRHNAAVIELSDGREEAAVVRCALESARFFLKAREKGRLVLGGGKSNRGIYIYRAGRNLEDGEFSFPCMGEAYRCLCRAARAALCAISRHLRLRTDAFNDLLDDSPLPPNEVSSSVLVASYSNSTVYNGKVPTTSGNSSINETEKSLLTLIASDQSGIQVCDPNGHWYVADAGSGQTDLLLLTGRALSHTTAGLRPAPSYRNFTSTDSCSASSTGGRVSLIFRLMPQANAILDCSRITAAGHCIPHSYQPISASQFMDDLSSDEDLTSNHPDLHTFETHNNPMREAEPSLRSVLSDQLSGAYLEDAVVVSCGHSFGGHMLKKVVETARCTLCNAEIDPGSLIPNIALRGAARVVRMEDERRLFRNSALRKRRQNGHFDSFKRFGKENSEDATDSDITRHLIRGVQYPFAVSERVVIKGNKRTPEKFVGKQAVITSQCLNGWYLLKILDSGESVRLQYRSLQKL